MSTGMGSRCEEKGRASRPLGASGQFPAGGPLDCGDYGGAAHVSPVEAADHCAVALALLTKVSEEYPEGFPLRLESGKAED